MKFDAEICNGVSCPECSFNKGEDGCLLAKRLDEIEITPEPCEDVVPRTSVEYICRKNTVSTNPYEHKYHDKFMQFMDDPEISDFGRWQHSNGFNTALVAVKCDLDRVPSAQPEPKEGEWVQIQRYARDAQPDLECPFCKHRIGWWDMGRYCAGCGAKLKGGAG
ncbi:MAG TPA: hypothetical protein DCF66_03920 [Lachnospiraceae bacterium]|nr:hypothetical protein [Lachnospiraceae bacterium]